MYNHVASISVCVGTSFGSCSRRQARLLEAGFLFQDTSEKASLSSSSSGGTSLKGELSESTDLPPEGFQAPCGKDEDRACDEILSEENFHLETIEKGISRETVAACMHS